MSKDSPAKYSKKDLDLCEEKQKQKRQYGRER